MSISPDTVQALVDEIFSFGRTLRTALSSAEDDPLPSALVGVLVVLATTGECRQNELAAQLCVSQSSLSRQIADLVDAGMIERRADPADGRAFRIHVTADGCALVAKIRAVRAARLRTLLNEWDQDDAAVALNSIEKLNHTISGHTTDGAAHTKASSSILTRNVSV